MLGKIKSNSGANGENRTHTPKPEWDFKSHASTYSATLAHVKKMEEVAGLEPAHTGFAIPGITNFAIPPQIGTKLYQNYLNFFLIL